MHQGNLEWFADFKREYPQHFVRQRVLEIGSLNMNGTVRGFFDGCRYVGVDKTPGPDVDVVATAQETSFAVEEFDTFVCLSEFEHDPRWLEGLRHNLQWVRRGGLVILCWGADGNCHHAPEPWAPVLVETFMAATKELPMTIVDAFFEATRYAPCQGAYDVLAIKA